MSDIFREVEEDLRHDRIKEAWDKYGNYVIAFASLIAILTGGYQLWQSMEASNRVAQADQYLAAIESLQNGSTEAAQDALQEIQSDGSGGYPALAGFQQAAIYVREDDLESAIKAYDSISAQSGIEQILRDLAKIKAAQLLMDTGSRSDLEARIGTLTVETNPWRFAAREILAFVAFRDGDIATARDEYASLAGEPGLTPQLRGRVEEMRLVIGPMALEPLEEPVEGMDQSGEAADAVPATPEDMPSNEETN